VNIHIPKLEYIHIPKLEYVHIPKLENVHIPKLENTHIPKLENIHIPKMVNIYLNIYQRTIKYTKMAIKIYKNITCIPMPIIKSGFLVCIHIIWQPCFRRHTEVNTAKPLNKNAVKN
jgi:hypothetical protein